MTSVCFLLSTLPEAGQEESKRSLFLRLSESSEARKENQVEEEGRTELVRVEQESARTASPRTGFQPRTPEKVRSSARGPRAGKKGQIRGHKLPKRAKKDGSPLRLRSPRLNFGVG